MHHVFLATALSLYLGSCLTHASSDSSQKNGSHYLLKLDRSNTSVQRPARCTPCEHSTNFNHLDPEYRGNGADNLGYDWSSMAWGGLAFPRKAKPYMGGMPPGRGGRMMMSGWGRNEGNVRVVCDTCRVYWEGGAGGGRGGRQFGGEDLYGGQGHGARPPVEYEARVVSPTVGVLVKPGSRIAYVPSRSGEMYWDGVSGGGTRWDGFSNGISWVGGGGGSGEWDRSDSVPREGYGSGGWSPGNGEPYSSRGYGSWEGMKRSDGRGRGYYFTNGVLNDMEPQWRDRGYASDWHYGSTDQNGWNGNNMKWNYGGKQWVDNDRAANRFYFNTPQDRSYGPTDGRHQRYGNQYPNYQSAGRYPLNFRPQPSWPQSGWYRPNDRFPSSFPQANPASGDGDKPWDYSSQDTAGRRRPGPLPEWMRPGPSYPTPGSFDGGSGRFPANVGGYDKYSPSDRNDFERPWKRPSGYGPSKPTSSGTFPYGGNRYPDGDGRPSFSVGGGHLFIPNADNRQPNYPNAGPGPGGSRPAYPMANRKPAEYPGNRVGTYPGAGGRPFPDDRPSVMYTGGRPSGEGPPGGYPSGGGTGYGYPTAGPVAGSGTYPGGSRPGFGYPSYPGADNLSPSGASRPGGYPGSGGPPDKYGGGDSSDAYPRPGSRPTPGGSPYPGGDVRPGLYPDEGYPQPAHVGATRPTGYPTGVRPDRYPEEYPGWGSGGPSGVYQQGGKNPAKGYYTGFITELAPDDGQFQYGNRHPSYFGSDSPGNSSPGKDRDKYFYGGSYASGPLSGEKSRYPAYSEDRYSGGGGGGYPAGDKGGYEGGRDRFYYGESGGKGKYPDGYLSNHRHTGGDFDRNQGGSGDKNSWNYGENERKDGIYRRSGGSYPPYRGGQYYTSSYLASMATTSGSTVAGTEPKTQTMAKADDVTQSTLDSS